MVIPEKYVWEFMKEFGNIFATRRSDGGREIKAVEGYYEHPMAGTYRSVLEKMMRADSGLSFSLRNPT